MRLARRTVVFRTLVPALLVLVLLYSVHRIGDPQATPAAPTSSSPSGTTPQLSVVFVIDSSISMFPAYGPNYFDLARDGIAELLSRPGFPMNGQIEIGVIQYTKRSQTLEYDPCVHWMPLRQIISLSDRESAASIVRNLEPSKHASASLMEIGLLEATEILRNSSNADTTTERHIVLLSTGEYRISAQTEAPPDCYGWPANPCPLSASCKDASRDPIGEALGPGFYNRSCVIRKAAATARQAIAVNPPVPANIRISTLRLGPDWANNLPEISQGGEMQHPYGNPHGNPPPDYCLASPPSQPDRDGLLKELANCCGDGSVECSPPGQNDRIYPFYPFQCASCDWVNSGAGTEFDVAATIAEWMCGWLTSPLDADTDGVSDLCDNCPARANPCQSDCDVDGVGDACQLVESSECLISTDSDLDGLCNSLDGCWGGDDCLVNRWAFVSRCPDDIPLDECGVDCDHNGQADLCQAAIGCGNLLDCAQVPATCNSIPDKCDLRRQEGEFPGWSSPGYYEDFENVGSPLVAGWALSSGAPTDGLTIEMKHPEDDPSSDHVLQIKHVDGSGAWYVEGIGFSEEILPCVPDGNGCNPDRFGIIEVTVDLYIDNDLDGTAYDLYVLDPAQQDFDLSKRVHLRFEDDHGRDDVGKIWTTIEAICPGDTTPYGAREDGMRAIGTYPTAEWFKLTIRLDEAAHYQGSGQDDNQRCLWRGNGCSVKSAVNGPSGTTLTDKPLRELGATRPFINRGAQLRLVTDNRSCDCMRSTVATGDENWDWRLACPSYAEYPYCSDCRDGYDGWYAWIDDHCPPKPDGSRRDPCTPDGCPITDCRDNCPAVDNRCSEWQIDSDGNGWGDACDGFGIVDDIDFDSYGFYPDGLPGAYDNCPKHYNPLATFHQTDAQCAVPPGLRGGTVWQPDADCDGVGDACDNCPLESNRTQLNADNDSFGDACDLSPASSAPASAPPSQCLPGPNGCPAGAPGCCDCDGDGDRDNFFCSGERNDNCPFTINGNQLDSDGDGYGDACDRHDNAKTDQTDVDRDGLDDQIDPCSYDSGNTDADGDGIGNGCDNCRHKYNPDQFDSNHDNVGDACQPGLDSDDDGVPNCPSGHADASCADEAAEVNLGDNCPYIANPTQTVSSTPGIGAACIHCYISQGSPGDADCNRILDTIECDPGRPAEPLNGDGDNKADQCDNCPTVPNSSQVDLDSDKVGDGCDNCPAKPNTGQEDFDRDGVGDACDNCQRVGNPPPAPGQPQPPLTMEQCTDCNNNNVLDFLDIVNCDGNPDCADCDNNNVPDSCDISANPGLNLRCPSLGRHDECDRIYDCNDNCIDDASETLVDCNANDLFDACEIQETPWLDVGTGVIDAGCPSNPYDEHPNGVPDVCEANDCNEDCVVDTAQGVGDCNGDGRNDWCDVLFSRSDDCNMNLVPDECETSLDCDGNDVIDTCEWMDCNENEVFDGCDVYRDCSAPWGQIDGCRASASAGECLLNSSCSCLANYTCSCTVGGGCSTSCGGGGGEEAKVIGPFPTGGTKDRVRSHVIVEACGGPRCGTGFSCVDILQLDELTVRAIDGCERSGNPCGEGARCICSGNAWQCVASHPGPGGEEEN